MGLLDWLFGAKGKSPPKKIVAKRIGVEPPKPWSRSKDAPSYYDYNNSSSSCNHSDSDNSSSSDSGGSCGSD